MSERSTVLAIWHFCARVAFALSLVKCGHSCVKRVHIRDSDYTPSLWQTLSLAFYPSPYYTRRLSKLYSTSPLDLVRVRVWLICVCVGVRMWERGKTENMSCNSVHTHANSALCHTPHYCNARAEREACRASPLCVCLPVCD